MRPILTAAVLACTAIPAMAEGWALADAGAEFTRISDRAAFMDLVDDGPLTRFGISVEVAPDGSISGNAYGFDVTGRWDWQDGYFCRALAWGSKDLGQNCQSVSVSGDYVRFTSDRGAGDFADLRAN